MLIILSKDLTHILTYGTGTQNLLTVDFDQGDRFLSLAGKPYYPTVEKVFGPITRLLTPLHDIDIPAYIIKLYLPDRVQPRNYYIMTIDPEDFEISYKLGDGVGIAVWLRLNTAELLGINGDATALEVITSLREYINVVKSKKLS
jgi:hypothetical protein